MAIYSGACSDSAYSCNWRSKTFTVTFWKPEQSHSSHVMTKSSVHLKKHFDSCVCDATGNNMKNFSSVWQVLEVSKIPTYKIAIMALSDGGKLYRAELALVLCADEVWDRHLPPHPPPSSLVPPSPQQSLPPPSADPPFQPPRSKRTAPSAHSWRACQ